MPVRIILVCALLTVLAPGRAEILEVPLTVDSRYLAGRVAAALELDATGAGRLEQDACNRVELADLQVEPDEGVIHASLALAVHTGATVFGRCRGPSPWRGRIHLELVPGVDPDGLVVVLTPHAVDLRRPDGSPALLTTPVRMLAESLILPRIGRARVDLSAQLAAIDDLIHALLRVDEPPPARLLPRSRLSALETRHEGLVATLAIEIEPPELTPPESEPPLEDRELAEWQRLEDELDGFLTTVIVHFAVLAKIEDLRLDLLSVLLDARHEIALALAGEEEFGDDPVRALFIRSWDRLRVHLPVLAAQETIPADAGLALAGFLAGGDAIRALDALGPQYGVEITRDGLRRLARLLLAGETPVAFTPLPLGIDPQLRELMGLERTGTTRGDTRGLLLAILDWFIPSVYALGSVQDPAKALQGMVPRLATLDEYLNLVSALLEVEVRARLDGASRVPRHWQSKMDPLIRATAWKESCWRQFIGTQDNPRVLRSGIGAVGMMQINGRVWRGLYDLERLAEEVRYNVGAGIEILEHYLVDYAIRRGEHEQPGGDENLVRATYAAYNGGPSHLSRYRRADTAPRLRAIDKEFWRHYQVMKTDRWPDVASCYPVG